jgi:hypothetical protein
VAHGVGHAQASDTALTLGSGPTMHSREGGYIKEREGEKGSERREDDAEQEGGRRKKRIPCPNSAPSHASFTRRLLVLFYI